jgi:hypothetical protein
MIGTAKMIHISSEVHKKLRVLASLEERSMQEVADTFLTECLEKRLPESLPELKDRKLEPA